MIIEKNVIDSIVEFANKNANSGTANFGVCTKDRVLWTQFSAPCHWALHRAPKSPYLFSCIRRRGVILKEVEVKKYLQHLFDSVYFKEYILTPDVNWVYDNQVFIVDGEIDSNVNLFLMISSRQIWEYPQVVRHTNELCDRGLPFAVAMSVAVMVNVRNDDVTLDRGSCGHSPLPCNLPLNKVLGLWEGKYEPTNKGNVSWEYSGWFNSIIGVKAFPNRTIRDVLEEVFTGNNDKYGNYKHPFPFRSIMLKNVKVKSCRVEVFYNLVADTFTKLLTEYKGAKNEAA